MDGKFYNYLLEKFGKNSQIIANNGEVNANINIENGSVSVNYNENELNINANYGAFTEEERPTLKAYVDNYNENDDKLYTLSLVDGYINLKYKKLGVTAEQAIVEVENVVSFINIETVEIRSDATRSRVVELMKKASKYEEENRHDLALITFEEIRKLENGSKLNIYERMAFLYHLGINGSNFKFPKNNEYALECYKLAIKYDDYSILLPHHARKIAKSLGNEELEKEFVELGNEIGTWDYLSKLDGKFSCDF